MTRHPAFPSNLSLREDECVDQLLYQQQTAAAEFRTLVSRFIADTARIEFPLGHPAPGYDEASVQDLLNDMLAEHPPEWFADRAAELAREATAPDPDRAYEERRDRLMEDRWATQ